MKCPVKCRSNGVEHLKKWTMETSRPTKSSFTRKSSSLAWTSCSMCTLTPCQYTHILQASDPLLHTPPEAPMFFLRKCVLEELVSTICHGCPRTSPIDSNGSHIYCASCDCRNERVTWQMKTNIWVTYHMHGSSTAHFKRLKISCGLKDEKIVLQK